MRSRTLILVCLCALALCLPSKPAEAQFGGCLPGFCGGGISAACVTSGTAAAFLARTSGLDATHIAAYTALGNSLDAHHLVCKLDMLHIYATQDSTTALLNFVQNAYNGVAHGTPAFTADRGFLGIDNSATVYISTGFTPFTAVGSKFKTLNAHLSAWSLTSGATAQAIIGSTDAVFLESVIPRFTDDRTYFAVNSSYPGTQPASTDGRGHFLGERIDNLTLHGYKNGSSILSATSTSISLLNVEIVVLGLNQNGTIFGGGALVAQASIGAYFTPAEEALFYGDLRTYMTAVGVP